MRTFQLVIVVTAIVLTPFASFSQDFLVTKIAKKNSAGFTTYKETFTGKGWDTLIDQIKRKDLVLIAEDYSTNEVPYFATAVTDKVRFDNFFCEIDAFSGIMSFYAFEPEIELLKRLVKTNISIYGIDHVLLNVDGMVCSNLKMITKNEEAKKIYENIEEKSKAYFLDLIKSPSKSIYLVTDDCEKQINELLKLDLSAEEKVKIEALKLTVKNYKEQNLFLRVRLMKNSLMDEAFKGINRKSLFRYGSGYLEKGIDPFMFYDKDNLANNIFENKIKNSMRILIVGKSGSQGSRFKEFPEKLIDENSYNFKTLRPLFSAAEGKQWYCLNMMPLRKAIKNGEIIDLNIGLSKIIKEFDFVVIIPKVTSAVLSR